MAKLTLLTKFSLLLHSVIGATLRDNLHGLSSPHVSLLSSTRPFPLNEHLEGAMPSLGNANKFMLTFYQNLVDGHSLSKAAQSNIDIKGEVNTIRSIAPQDDVFNIRALPPTDDVHHVELRFNTHTFRRRWLKIEIKRMNKTIRTFQCSASNSYDITAFVRPWISKIEKDLHVEVKQNKVSRDDSILLIFSNDRTQLNKLSKISNVSEEITDEHHSRNKRAARRRRRDCHLSNMRISFSNLGWGQYIIFPKTYNARVCKGICSTSVTQQRAVTNHAMMQSLMRQSAKGNFPLPCCVPKTLSPLSILYFEDDQILVKHHKNMVAEECGCE
ncbi:nodal-like [Saccostrea cucullata]|uniref:nodal-like n=1 Tax=Saccostrea cuccullata TaxID=36930 RepID=UPI002ED5B780